jgi:hypothetical protein
VTQKLAFHCITQRLVDRGQLREVVSRDANFRKDDTVMSPKGRTFVPWVNCASDWIFGKVRNTSDAPL